MMKVMKKYIIFITPVILFFSFLIPLSAETKNYYGIYKATQHFDSSVTPPKMYYDLTLVADDENAYGYINISGLGTFYYSGYVTYYSNIQCTTTSGIGISNSGSFSGTYNSQAEITTLDSTQYQALLSAINSVNATDINIINAINSLKSDIMSVLNNIDDIIDNISWQNADNAIIKGYSTTVDGTYSFDQISTNQKDIYMKIHLPLYYDNRLWKIKTDITFNGRTSAQIFDTSIISFPHVYYLNNNTGDLTERQPRIYPFSNGSYLTLYIDSNMSMSNSNDIIIQVHREYTGLRVLNLQDFPSYINYIDDNDIEFWQLLNILQNATEYYEKYTELDDTNAELSPAVDDMVTNEDNLISDFDTSISNPNVKPSTNSSSDTSGWGNGFTSSIGFVGYVYNQLLQSAQGGNPIYMLTNFSLMLGLALLIIGKRG